MWPCRGSQTSTAHSLAALLSFVGQQNTIALSPRSRRSRSMSRLKVASPLPAGSAVAPWALRVADHRQRAPSKANGSVVPCDTAQGSGAPTEAPAPVSHARCDHRNTGASPISPSSAHRSEVLSRHHLCLQRLGACARTVPLADFRWCHRLIPLLPHRQAHCGIRPMGSQILLQSSCRQSSAAPTRALERPLALQGADRIPPRRHGDGPHFDPIQLRQ